MEWLQSKIVIALVLTSADACLASKEYNSRSNSINILTISYIPVPFAGFEPTIFGIRVKHSATVLPVHDQV
jgi:hypothetical protein